MTEMKRFNIITIFACLSFSCPLVAQLADTVSWCKPLDSPISLSGNFGELRSNHFHGGVDFRTESVENKRVYAVQEGYVSRISISPIGYGKALYITHPQGFVTVSAHLNGFAPKIEKVVRAMQLKNESFAVDLNFNSNELPVSKGEWVAFSGNTGSSGGPHLHFELRNGLDHQLDFLNYITREYKDSTAPAIFGLSAYCLTDQGAFLPPLSTTLYPVKREKTIFSMNRTLRLWGKVAFGIRALDYVDKSEFNYGVKKVELFVDSMLIFESVMNSVPFTETRLMNSFIDYQTWVEKRLFYQKSYIEPGNIFPNTKALQNGVLNISEERIYSCRYRLTDDVGNVSELPFEVVGDPTMKAVPSSSNIPAQTLFNWSENRVMQKDIIIDFPKESLFTNVNFVYSTRPSSKYLTPIMSLHEPTTPLRSEITLSIKLPKPLIAEPRQYILSYINKRGAVRYSTTTIKGDRMEADVKLLGDYAVTVDSVAPTVTPLGQTQWGKNGMIRFTVSDTQTRIKIHKGYIDGKFVLFEYDAKSRLIFCNLSKETVVRGKPHTLRLVVADECGNSVEQTFSFHY